MLSFSERQKYLKIFQDLKSSPRDIVELKTADIIKIILWVSYERHRTGLKFKDVAHILGYEQQQKRDQGKYMFITRHTVLGRWHELKMTHFNPQKYYNFLREIPHPQLIEHLINMLL